MVGFGFSGVELSGSSTKQFICKKHDTCGHLKMFWDKSDYSDVVSGRLVPAAVCLHLRLLVQLMELISCY
jgi:hypothetical protein